MSISQPLSPFQVPRSIFVWVSLCISVYITLCLSVSLSKCISVYVSVGMSLCTCICLFLIVCLCVCTSLVPLTPCLADSSNVVLPPVASTCSSAHFYASVYLSVCVTVFTFLSLNHYYLPWGVSKPTNRLHSLFDWGPFNRRHPFTKCLFRHQLLTNSRQSSGTPTHWPFNSAVHNLVPPVCSWPSGLADTHWSEPVPWRVWVRSSSINTYTVEGPWTSLSLLVSKRRRLMLGR